MCSKLRIEIKIRLGNSSWVFTLKSRSKMTILHTRPVFKKLIIRHI